MLTLDEEGLKRIKRKAPHDILEVIHFQEQTTYRGRPIVPSAMAVSKMALYHVYTGNQSCGEDHFLSAARFGERLAGIHELAEYVP